MHSQEGIFSKRNESDSQKTKNKETKRSIDLSTITYQKTNKLKEEAIKGKNITTYTLKRVIDTLQEYNSDKYPNIVKKTQKLKECLKDLYDYRLQWLQEQGNEGAFEQEFQLQKRNLQREHFHPLHYKSGLVLRSDALSSFDQAHQLLKELEKYQIDKKSTLISERLKSIKPFFNTTQQTIDKRTSPNPNQPYRDNRTASENMLDSYEIDTSANNLESTVSNNTTRIDQTANFPQSHAAPRNEEISLDIAQHNKQRSTKSSSAAEIPYENTNPEKRNRLETLGGEESTTRADKRHKEDIGPHSNSQKVNLGTDALTEASVSTATPIWIESNDLPTKISKQQPTKELHRYNYTDHSQYLYISDKQTGFSVIYDKTAHLPTVHDRLGNAIPIYTRDEGNSSDLQPPTSNTTLTQYMAIHEVQKQLITTYDRSTNPTYPSELTCFRLDNQPLPQNTTETILNSKEQSSTEETSYKKKARATQSTTEQQHQIDLSKSMSDSQEIEELSNQALPQKKRKRVTFAPNGLLEKIKLFDVPEEGESSKEDEENQTVSNIHPKESENKMREDSSKNWERTSTQNIKNKENTPKHIKGVTEHEFNTAITDKLTKKINKIEHQRELDDERMVKDYKASIKKFKDIKSDLRRGSSEAYKALQHIKNNPDNDAEKSAAELLIYYMEKDKPIDYQPPTKNIIPTSDTDQFATSPQTYEETNTNQLSETRNSTKLTGKIDNLRITSGSQDIIILNDDEPTDLLNTNQQLTNRSYPSSQETNSQIEASMSTATLIGTESSGKDGGQHTSVTDLGSKHNRQGDESPERPQDTRPWANRLSEAIEQGVFKDSAAEGIHRWLDNRYREVEILPEFSNYATFKKGNNIFGTNNARYLSENQGLKAHALGDIWSKGRKKIKEWTRAIPKRHQYVEWKFSPIYALRQNGQGPIVATDNINDFARTRKIDANALSKHSRGVLGNPAEKLNGWEIIKQIRREGT